MLAGVDDLEVLAHEDLELLAGARRDVRLVRRASQSPLVSVRTIVAPAYLARTAASTFSFVSPVSAVSPRPPPAAVAAAPPAAAAALVGLDGRGLERRVHEHDLQRAAGGLDVRVVGRAVRAAGLRPQHRRARDLLERGGLDLGGDVARERLALRARSCERRPRSSWRSCRRRRRSRRRRARGRRARRRPPRSCGWWWSMGAFLLGGWVCTQARRAARESAESRLSIRWESARAPPPSSSPPASRHRPSGARAGASPAPRPPAARVLACARLRS